MGEQESEWVSEEGCEREDEGSSVVVEVRVRDVVNGRAYVVRRCVGEVTCKMVVGVSPLGSEGQVEKVKREMRRVVDELESFILLGVY